MLSKTLNDIKFWLLVSLTLGLAPFFPEPHLFGKLRWLFGDPSGMQLMDVGDLLMHGLPWILLIRAIIVHLIRKSKGSPLSQ